MVEKSTKTRIIVVAEKSTGCALIFKSISGLLFVAPSLAFTLVLWWIPIERGVTSTGLFCTHCSSQHSTHNVSLLWPLIGCHSVHAALPHSHSKVQHFFTVVGITPLAQQAAQSFCHGLIIPCNIAALAQQTSSKDVSAHWRFVAKTLFWEIFHCAFPKNFKKARFIAANFKFENTVFSGNQVFGNPHQDIPHSGSPWSMNPFAMCHAVIEILTPWSW